MGYWKENFPGSAAYYQRIRVARAGIAYVFVATGVIFAFSPFRKRVQKYFEETGYTDPQWMKDFMSRKQLFGEVESEELYLNRSASNVGKILEVDDKDLSGDLTRPKWWNRENIGDFRPTTIPKPVLPPTEAEAKATSSGNPPQ